jgi:hypothetical protein
MAVTIVRTVRPSPAWQDTLIRLRAGNRLVIDVEGVWSPDMHDQIVWCGADGIYRQPAGDGYVMPGTNIGAVIGRLGQGSPLGIGSRYDLVVPEDGVLFLAMNENPSRNCQAGQVTAHVIVFDEP